MSARMKIRFDNQKKRRRSQHKKQRLSKLVLLASAALLVACAVLLIRYGWQTLEARKLQKEVQADYAAAVNAAQQQSTPALENADAQQSPLPDAQNETELNLAAVPQTPDTPAPLAASAVIRDQFLSLYSKNKDLAGWLKSDAVPEIDFPVVLRDNDYYLYRDFYGRQSMSGTIFLDQSTQIQPRSQNLVLHGHNMKNGTMFGKLYQYLDIARVRTSPLIKFSTLYETSLYVPYAVSLVSVDADSPRFVPLVHPTFSTEGEAGAYAGVLKGMSSFQLPIDVSDGDRLLTLVTCYGDEQHERLVVAFRELRQDENKETIAALFAQFGG